MALKNDAQLRNTQEKLRELEQRYRARQSEVAANPHVQELTLRSMKQVINELKEEIARYQTAQPARH